jgi:putative DNA methylase
LGLEAHASDINPVAVLITKALIEIPPKFKDMPPVNPEAQKQLKTSQWYGAQGLAEDVRYYGKWIRDEAEKRIGHLYPKVKLPEEKGGGEATVIAWLWARTVKCPNPACNCQMPLVRSFELSTKKGKQAWVEPVIEQSHTPPEIHFQVKTGNGKAREGTVGRRGAICIACDTPVPLDYIRAQGKAKQMSSKLMAIVAESKRHRIYLPPNDHHEEIAKNANLNVEVQEARSGFLSGSTPEKLTGGTCYGYGLTSWGDLFTSRQLIALTTLSNLVNEVREQIKQDCALAVASNDQINLTMETVAYSDAIATYLGMGVSRLTNTLCTMARWTASRDQTVTAFARQAVPMTWDYPEVNTFNNAAGDYLTTINTMVHAISNLGMGCSGTARQQDATTFTREIDTPPLVFTTDPPYYDNISYAELSDFFYAWLRRSIGNIYPDLFSTLATPKEQELVYAPYRFGGNKEKARQFFEDGLKEAFRRTYEASHPDYPFTVFYAFKQTETDGSENGNGDLTTVVSTGWETMLESLIQSGFSVTGTWPMRTEMSNRPVASGSNALATSIALVCRPLAKDAPKTTRREFLNALNRELPNALRAMQQGNIAPVDLAQASIGPGMAVFSRYKQVLESDGSPMRVRTALQLINQALDEYLSEQEGEFDADTRWALTWFEQHQFEDGKFGDAETLSKAKVTSVQGLVNAGILTAKSGKARLLRRDELPKNWNPKSDDRTPDWEATQHLIHALDQQGESGAATLLSQLSDRAEIYRDLAYRLYSICDRKGWTQEAIAYNSLVISWAEISRLAAQQPAIVQGQLAGV